MKIGIKSIWILCALVLAAALIFAFNFYFDYMAYKEIGENFTEVFFTNLQAKIVLQVISFLVVFLIIYFNFRILKSNLTKLDTSFDFLKKKYLIIFFSLLFSFIVSSIIQFAVYDRLLLFFNPTFFNLGDPIFFKDIGYYLFQRPFLTSLFDSLIAIFVFISVIVFILYVFLYAKLGIRNMSEIFKVKSIAMHNLTNLSMIILINAISYLLKAEQILYSDSGAVSGAGYTEVHVWRTYYGIIPIILMAIVILAIFFINRNKLKLCLTTIAVYPLTYVVFLAIAMFIQTFVVKPQEVTMEAPYLSYNINYTRAAFKIDNVESKEFPISYELSKEDLESEKNMLSNIRIIDYPSTIKAINQVQSIRNFYKFNDIDIVKYDINGKPTAVAMAPREFNKDSLDPSARSFLNEKLRFTHGYGLIASHVNQVTAEGLPAFLIKDIPPSGIEGMPEVKEPRIYFGELTNDYVIVNSGYKELDYSSGQTDAEYSYQGKAGIKMNFTNKLLYSVYFGDFQLFISKLTDKNSKLLINRNIVERVKIVAPFLSVDNDPYILIDKNGKLKWIVNCYTTSSFYPYSQQINFNGRSINYIRESVKAVVDAFDGTVEFYITDEEDPIAQSYKKIYPHFFKEEKMPLDLSAHLQYPERMFNIQAEIFKRYHSDNTGIFYNKTDIWDFAKEKYQNEIKHISPYYSLMSLFGDKEELTLLIPYTMTNKDNLVAWFAVSCDNENYGRMVLYTFPKGESIYGTMQIENKIDNDPVISREMTLWGQGGSTVLRGNMLVIPIANSLIYVEPVYLASGTDASLPELKRVIVAYKDRVVMEESFEKAIFTLFNYKYKQNIDFQIVPSEPVENEEKVSSEVESNIVLYFDGLKKSMSENNWHSIGDNLAKLEEEINKLRKPANQP